MEVIDDELTETELKLDEEFKQNYIEYMSMYISSNINTVYKYYKCDSDYSLKGVMLMSKDTINLNEDEKNLLLARVNSILKDVYKIQVVSGYADKLIIKEIEV